MIRSLWTARTGLDAQQTQLDVISNNLANVATNGYKRQRAVFEDLLYQTMRQPGAQQTEENQISSGLQVGTGARVVATERVFTQGGLQQTGNSLDVAIQGSGFVPIQYGDDTAYTRDGAFQLDNQGQLVTASGYVVGNGVTIPENATSISIGKSGIVSVTVPNAVEPQEVGQIPLVSFVNAGGLQSIGENLYLETASSGVANEQLPGTNGVGVFNQGYVETSNVNVAEELVSMIITQRAYELNSRAIQTSDQMLGRLTQL